MKKHLLYSLIGFGISLCDNQSPKVRSKRKDKVTTNNPSIDDYIAGFPEDLQIKLNKLRAVIREEAPEAEEKMKNEIAPVK